MNPLIISSVPYHFPNGAYEYSCFMANMFDTDIYNIPDGYAEPYYIEIPKSVLDPEPYKIDTGKYDCTILGSAYLNLYAGTFMKLLPKLPRPIIVVIHEKFDIEDREMTHFWDTFSHYISGYITNMKNETLWLKKKGYRVHQTVVPYSPFNLDESLYKNRPNSILSLGRMLPEKGHRSVAALAEIGYSVTIAGQALDYQEYKLYHDKLVSTGANVVDNPTTEEINTICQEHKVFMNYIMMPDEETSISYSAMRAINGGCIPIVADTMRGYYDEIGLKFFATQSPLSSTREISRIFNDDDFYVSAAAQNLNALVDSKIKWTSKVEKFIRNL